MFVQERMAALGSVLEAVKAGIWDFEPAGRSDGEFDATDAMPGSSEKLEVMARRAASGLPLWHPSDRQDRDTGMDE
jgi:hypothetical protein